MKGGRQGGSCGLGCCWLAAWLRLAAEMISGAGGLPAVDFAEWEEDRQQHRGAAGQRATAAGRDSGETMDYNGFLEGEDEGVGIGAVPVLWSKPISGLAVESRQRAAEQAEQIPAGGRAPGAWGFMDILGSWPVITGSDSNGLKLEVCTNTHTQCMTTGVSALVRAVGEAAESGKDPEQSTEGLGGTYFIRNGMDKTVAIFKPCDEEPMAPNNPKGFVGRSLGAAGLKPTVRVGEAAIREVAAYLLDKGFANVPHTLLVRASHPCFHYATTPLDPYTESSDLSISVSPQTELSLSAEGPHHLKVGSLQEYVSHMCDTSEIGSSRFNVGDVHRIGILDVRLYNTDRHAGNILVRKPSGKGARSGAARLQESQYELVPIDHGFCLPEALEPPYFEWLYWPQAMLPFSEEELQYIANLDFKADKKLLMSALPILPVECLRTLEVTTLLLQRCAAAGLSLHEIGEVMSRPMVALDSELSELERICRLTKQEVMVHMWNCGLGISMSDSDGEVSSYSRSPRPVRGDELQFCIDDVQGEQRAQDFDDMPPSHTTFDESSRLGCCSTSKQLPSDAEPLESSFVRLTACPPPMAEQAAKHSPRAPVGRVMACHKATRSVSLQLPSAHQHRPMGLQGQLRQRKLSMQISRPIQGLPLAYPPPVEGAAPSSANDIFSHMGEEDWGVFMELLTGHIQEALDEGLWRTQERVNGRGQSATNFGTSCPKF
eukprot:evm.model.scf_1440.8 EVM.evm.TU.scf_1440.8   scf_1440:26393-32625(-)